MLPQVQHILYATNLGQHTRPVFRHAVQLAHLYGAKISMLHALEPLSEYGHAIVEHYVAKEALQKIHQEGIARVRQTMQARVQAFVDEELQQLGLTHLDIDYLIDEGVPSELILEYAQAQNVDLIVLGSHSEHGFFGRKLLGDTAHQVSLHAQVPVLVVPNKHQAPAKK